MYFISIFVLSGDSLDLENLLPSTLYGRLFVFLSELSDLWELLTVCVYCLGSHDAHVSFTIILTQAVVEGDLIVFPCHH